MDDVGELFERGEEKSSVVSDDTVEDAVDRCRRIFLHPYAGGRSVEHHLRLDGSVRKLSGYSTVYHRAVPDEGRVEIHLRDTDPYRDRSPVRLKLGESEVAFFDDVEGMYYSNGFQEGVILVRGLV